MIKRSDEMLREMREGMRGGKGTVTITHIASQDELNGRCRLLAKLTLAPGTSIGRHVHEDEEEIFYILAGEALIDDNGVVSRLSAGDAAVTGGGAYHSVESVGASPLEMLATILTYK